MDAWSSPWNDGDTSVVPPPSKPDRTGDDDASALKVSPPLPASLANAFDASDPWSAGVALHGAEPDPPPVHHDLASTIHTGASHSFGSTSAVPSHPLPSSAWQADISAELPDVRPDLATSPSQSTLQIPPTQPHRTLTRQRSLLSEDPWTTDASSSWGAEPTVSASALSAAGPDALASGWGSDTSTFESTDKLDKQFSSIHLDFHNGKSFDEDESWKNEDEAEHSHDTATNLDAWAAEASSREEKARRLDREEIDKLKVDARKLIASIKTEEETLASFVDPTKCGSGWSDLFGSQGTLRDKMSHLQTSPSALMSSSGALRSDVMQASPATLIQVRSSIDRTENRGVKLASFDNSLSWQRGARPITKADWLPDALSGKSDGDSLGKTTSAAMTSSSSTSSGPGWIQTSNSDTRSTSGASFLASFFKGRQASAGGTVVGIPESIRSRTSSERSTTPPSRRESPAVPAAMQFEAYRDNADVRYSDDPTGPDLLSLDTPDAAPTSSAQTGSSARAEPTKGPGLLSRWRNSGLFKASTNKANPSWAASGIRNGDLDWLEENDSTDSRTGPYRYDEEGDHPFAGFQDTVTQPSVLSKPSATTSARAVDPFDNLFGPAVPTNAGITATSSPRSSLSASRMSGEGGMMTINTNLGRANSIARNSATSPLQPPPQAQNKRSSIAPPPRANNASPRVISTVSPAQLRADPFADFLSGAPAPQDTANANAFKPPGTSTAAGKASVKGSSGNGLTADDLLFFDSL